jgi:Na+-translocating ferredoxin:NAD+ oxidoreductase RnfG subunit
MKKILLAVLALVFTVPLMAEGLKEQAVKQLLPDSDLKAAVFNLTPADVAAVQAALGNQMPVRPNYEIYASKTGAVVIEEQMGKWGIITSAVLIDPVTKKMRDLVVISMSEKHGVGVKTGNFIGQFVGKGPDDKFDLGNGIIALSGATVSSKAMVITVKRALAVYKLFSSGKNAALTKKSTLKS